MRDIVQDFELVIEPNHLEKEYWKDLWRYRELFYFLAWRDILVRYKQAVFGVAWALLKPLLTMVIFTFVFGKLAKLPSDGIPYPVFVLAGMLPWQLFSGSLSEASGSVVTSANIISKVYFPRMIIPASAIIVNIFDFVITFAIFLVFMAYEHVRLHLQILLLPLFLLLSLGLSSGIGLYLAALNVRFRDFRYVIPFVLQFAIYISPVGYSSSIVPTRYQWLYVMNPMVGVIDGFRWAFFGVQTPVTSLAVTTSCILTFLIFLLGIDHFRRTERSFADII
jgi:lipopolysaccharide transport system permease protein